MRYSPKSCTRTRCSKPVRFSGAAVLLAAGAALFLALAANLCMGAAYVPLSDFVGQAARGETAGQAYRIIAFVRLPRTIAAMLAGSALAVGGAILQAVLGNALAGPNIIGVNAGSGLAATLCAALLPVSAAALPAAAFAGALTAALCVYGIARGSGASRLTIVLAGVAVSNILNALTDAVLTLAPDTQLSRMAFLIGSFSGISMDTVRFAGAAIAAGLLAALLGAPMLNVLSLGEETAASLGLRVTLCRFFFITVAALLSGAAVSFAGLLGFVGLLVPHAARFLSGHDARLTLPLCALLGAAFTLLCDLLARMLFSPFELPVGIVMSLLGGPFFLFLLFCQKRGRLHD